MNNQFQYIDSKYQEEKNRNYLSVYNYLSVIIIVVLVTQFVYHGYGINKVKDFQNNTIDDYTLQKKVQKLHEHVWTYFFHPDVNLIYDYIAPLDDKNRWEFLPTRNEILNGIPNLAGWGTGMEDCALNGGAYLAGMVYRFEVTRKEEHAEEARRIYKGLQLLGTVSSQKGFVPRGVLPDGRSFYPNSSVDQYTFYLFGLWTYYHSNIPTEDERKQISSIVGNICERIKKDNFNILSSDNKRAKYCNIGRISVDRSSRLLATFRIGFDLTKEKRWMKIYTRMLKTNNYSRLQDVNSYSNINKLTTYSILQNQASLFPLVQLEKNFPIKANYKNAMNLHAKIAKSSRLMAYQNYRPDIHTDEYDLGLWRVGKEPRPKNFQEEHLYVREPSEALLIMLFANNNYLLDYEIKEEKDLEVLRNICRKLISTYEYKKMRRYGLIYTEIAYWLADKQKLLKYKQE
ncbi:hypothetical protein [Mariniphaga sediminis]|uniref:hypothetical protein n=1 Tax=Mariniphaga sediminis TaxID=1628158 RepID=UPI00356AACB1